MDHFGGLDVSVKETSVCIVDDTGKIVREVTRRAMVAAICISARGCLRARIPWPKPCGLHARKGR